MADYKALAQTIIDSVGGVQNVRGLTHCVTRLRFTLADPKPADIATLEKTDGVIKVNIRSSSAARSPASMTRSRRPMASRETERWSPHPAKTMARTTP